MTADLEARLDAATTALLPELRATKHLNEQALAQLLAVADAFAEALGSHDTVQRTLVGKLWFPFTAILTEAEYSDEPEALTSAAWDYAERLRHIFGPAF